MEILREQKRLGNFYRQIPRFYSTGVIKLESIYNGCFPYTEERRSSVNSAWEEVRNFMLRMDDIAAELLDPHDTNGHPDLPDYLPYIGARYSVRGYDLPLSIFRGEGVALFLIARALQPGVIAECYTGTGYAACCLAAGAPSAQVFTTDNFTEGGLGESGIQNVQAMREKLGLSNLHCFHGTVERLRQEMRSPATLYLSDGPYEGTPPLAAGAVHIRHDDASGQVDGRRFVIEGGSHMSVTCPTIEMRDRLMEELQQMGIRGNPR